MTITARDLMSSDVRTVRPDMTLPDLERALLDAKVGGFPVVDGDRLVGVISRSDVVRQLAVEQSVAELASGYQYETDLVPAADYVSAIGADVGRRMEGRRVEEVMVRDWIGVPPETPVEDVARRMVERRIHRLLVVDGEKLIGIVSTLDLARLIAESKLESP